jgi:hypothetical protein
MRERGVPFRGSKPLYRFALLVRFLGGPSKTARYLGVSTVSLWRWRVGQPLSEKRALQLRAVALDIAQQMTALAYELQSDAAVGRRRRYRDIARRTDLITAVRPYRERGKDAAKVKANRWPGRGKDGAK